jgi:hypothetical protein
MNCLLQIWGGLSRQGSLVFPRLRLVTRIAETPPLPSAARVLSTASPARGLSEAEPI